MIAITKAGNHDALFWKRKLHLLLKKPGGVQRARERVRVTAHAREEAEENEQRRAGPDGQRCRLARKLLHVLARAAACFLRKIPVARAAGAQHAEVAGRALEGGGRGNERPRRIRRDACVNHCSFRIAMGLGCVLCSRPAQTRSGHAYA